MRFRERGRVRPSMQRCMGGRWNTILIGQADAAVPWTKPADMVVTPTALPRVGGLWGNGFCCAMADGSVRFVNTRRIDPQLLRNLIDPRDGNVIPQDW